MINWAAVLAAMRECLTVQDDEDEEDEENEEGGFRDDESGILIES